MWTHHPADATMALAELRDHILSFLSGDIDAMRQCSLVSKTWTASTDPFLFSTLAIDAQVDWEAEGDDEKK